MSKLLPNRPLKGETMYVRLEIKYLDIIDFPTTKPPSYPSSPMLQSFFDTEGSDKEAGKDMDSAFRGTMESIIPQINAKVNTVVEYLKTKGIGEVTNDVGYRWVQKFGCSCGCSPAIRLLGIKGLNRKVISVTFLVYKHPDNDSLLAADKALAAKKKADKKKREEDKELRRVKAINNLPKEILVERNTETLQDNHEILERRDGTRYFSPCKKLMPSKDRAVFKEQLEVAFSEKYQGIERLYVITDKNTYQKDKDGFIYSDRMTHKIRGPFVRQDIVESISPAENVVHIELGTMREFDESVAVRRLSAFEIKKLLVKGILIARYEDFV